MEGLQRNITYNIVIFMTWTVTSFLCHQFGKLFLTSWRDWARTESNEERMPEGVIYEQVISAVVLTGCQLGFCVLFVSLDDAEAISKSRQRISKLTHAAATLATNFSMSLMASSSTFAIKMMEPVTSAIVQYILLRTAVTPWTVFSLPFIVGGAIEFVGNPLAVPGTALGILVAFVSNIVLAFRNIELKRMSSNGNSLPLRLRHGGRGLMLPIAAVVMVTSISLFLESQDILHQYATHILVCALMSASFHVAYSYVSTALVLTQMSVVSHAVANIMKRLLVVLMLYAFGQRTASIWNFLGLLLCTGGLLVYAWDKSKPDMDSNKDNSRIGNGKKWSIVAIFSVGFLVIVLPKHTPCEDARLALSKFDNSMPIFDALNHSQNEHNSFQAEALQQPLSSQLLPNLGSLPKPFEREFLDFLKTPLHHETDVNFLSEKLTTSTEIIKESQRLHFDIIGQMLKQFKYAFLIDMAAFENKGDPAISVGEIYFLARMNIEIVYYCRASHCSETTLHKARDLAQKYDSNELAILVHGGGNIVGYAAADLVRFKVIDLFPSYQIIVFPQSIWIRNWQQPFVQRTAKYYCCNPNLTIVLRDALSYSIAKRLYNGTTRLIMAPDMAFQIGHVPRIMLPVFDIMWIKRKDAETPRYQPPKHVPQNLSVHVSDWWQWSTPHAGSGLEQAFYITTNGFFYLQRGRVVITDRLHGHILSVLMDIPHVLIDNRAKKLSAYHNTWTRSLENTVITDDPQKALGLAIELLKKYNKTLPPIVPYLDVREDFRKAVRGVPDTSYP